jgi:hypothetical protein
LIVWPIWVGWHLPLLLIVATYRDFGLAQLAGWIVGIGFGSVLLTAMYQSTGRSILLVALWHAAYNLATTGTNALSAAIVTTGVVVASIVIMRRASRVDPASTSKGVA